MPQKKDARAGRLSANDYPNRDANDNGPSFGFYPGGIKEVDVFHRAGRARRARELARARKSPGFDGLATEGMVFK
jgi:hypothetical protein